MFFIFTNFFIQSVETITTIHNIWNLFASKNQLSSVTKLVHIMASHFVNYKLNFNICGLVSLDYSLLYMVCKKMRFQ